MEPQIGDMVRATMNGIDWFLGVYVQESETLAQYGVRRDDMPNEVRFFTHAEKLTEERGVLQEVKDCPFCGNSWGPPQSEKIDGGALSIQLHERSLWWLGWVGRYRRGGAGTVECAAITRMREGK